MIALRAAWSVLPLTEVADVRLGRQRSPKNHSGDHMRPYLRAANVTWHGLDLSDVKSMNFTDVEMSTYRLEPGDILLSEASGSASEVGKAALWTGEIADCAFQNTLIRLRPRSVDPRYLLHYFRWQALAGRFIEQSRGVGIHHIGRARLASWPTPVPLAAEQRRIVDILEDLLSRLDAADGYVDASVRRLRGLEEQLVLRHVLPADGAGAQSVWQAAEGTLSHLPDGWRWLVLDDVAEVVGGVTKDAKRQADPSFVEVPYLRVANVQRARLDLASVTTIRVARERADQLRLLPGDVLMNEGGDRDKLARGWVWGGEVEGCIHQNHVFRARPDKATVRSEWLAWCANTYGARWAQRHGRQSVNLASISLSTIRRMPIPVPPLAAQDSALEAISAGRSAINDLGAALEAAALRSRSLRRALLAAAFSGRLTGRVSDMDLAEELVS